MVSVIDPTRFLELFVPGPLQAHQRCDDHLQPARIVPSEDIVPPQPPTAEAEISWGYIKSLKSAFPDIQFTFLPTPDNPEDTTTSSLPTSRADLHLTVLSDDEDLFDDKSPNEVPREHKLREVFDQVLLQAELIFHHQHRTFLFMLVFFGSSARILHLDRSCLFVTKRFELADSDVLVNFLTRYAQLPPADRGYDSSAQPIDPFHRDPGSLSEMMRKCLQDAKARGEEDHVVDLWETSLDEKWPWWKLRVPDELMGEVRWFVVGKPSFRAPGVRGRGARCYIAVEAFKRNENEWELDTKFIYLKDCWRVVGYGMGETTDIPREGDTLAKLSAAKIVRVPTLVAHGDIKDQDTSANPNAWKMISNKHKCCLKTRQHYRVVIDKIGRPLSEFGNGSNVLSVFYDCVLAHHDATPVNVMHRNISRGNILLDKKKGDQTWHGLLTVWELFRDIEMLAEPKHDGRTGTMQFSSVSVLDDSSKPIGVADELECFFHVLVYYAVRFLKHNLPYYRVSLFLYNYFERSSGFNQKDGPTAPELKRSSVTLGRIGLHSCGIGDTLRFMWVNNLRSVDENADPETGSTTPAGTRPPPDYNHPLNEVIETLLSWFSALYELDTERSSASAMSSGSGSSQARRGGKLIPIGQGPHNTAQRRARTKAKTPGLSPEEEAELRALAKNLDDQSNVLELFEDVAVQLFPMHNGKDRAPEEGYVPCSSEPPQLPEMSRFTDSHDAKDGDQVKDGGATILDAPAPDDFAQLAAAVVPAGGDDERARHGDSSGSSSPSPVPIRPKRGREDDAGCEESAVRDTGKRGRY